MAFPVPLEPSTTARMPFRTYSISSGLKVSVRTGSGGGSSAARFLRKGVNTLPPFASVAHSTAICSGVT